MKDSLPSFMPTISYQFLLSHIKNTKPEKMCTNELSMLISSERRAGRKVVLLSLDISKAYDCLNLKKLAEALTLLDVFLHTRYWILNI